MTATIAQSQNTSIAGVVVWSAAILLLLAVGLLWAAKLKRKLKAEADDTATPSAGFTLSDLRQMHRAGQLTDAEFAKAKEKILDAAKKVAQRIPDPAEVVERDSVDAIRARRLAREALDQTPQPPPDDAEPV